MTNRIALIAAVGVLLALAFWHRPSRPVVTAASAVAGSEPTPRSGSEFHHRDGRTRHRLEDTVVYVAGAVKRPGLYHLRDGERAAQAVALAGGFTGGADPAGINLAQHASDGDEIYVPTAGEARHASTSRRTHGRRSRATPPPEGSIDVNRADVTELAAVPGIGRSIAGRIVVLRDREGAFASLDELLDVAGMTQTRLERARPYLQRL